MIYDTSNRYIYLLIKTFLTFLNSVIFMYTYIGMQKMVPSCINHNHGREQTWHTLAQNILSRLKLKEEYCRRSNKHYIYYNNINYIINNYYTNKFYSPTLRCTQIDYINYQQYHFLWNHDHFHVYHLMQFVE